MEQDINSHSSSTKTMAHLLRILGGHCYALPPKEARLFVRQDVNLLERWARDIRARIDELNALSDSFDLGIGMSRTKPLEHGGPNNDDLIGADRWMEVTKEGGSVRSPLLRKLDGLVRDYWNEGLWDSKLPIMIKIFEVAAQYRDEKHGSRYLNVVLLAKQVIERMKKHGGPTTDSYSTVWV
jgi:hypothetical protein